MAKRFNIIKVLEKEIEKGSIYITETGNFVPDDIASCNVQEEFIRALRNGEIGIEMSLAEFKEKQLQGKKNVHDLVKIVKEFLGILQQDELQETEEIANMEEEENTTAPSEQGGGLHLVKCKRDC